MSFFKIMHYFQTKVNKKQVTTFQVNSICVTVQLDCLNSSAADFFVIVIQQL